MVSDPGKTLQSTAEVVAAYVRHNHASRSDLLQLIERVGHALRDLGASAKPPAPKLTPAVPIRQSIHPDFIICLEDGRRMKSLKRYLTSLGMTPTQYRQKWGLPADYPIVAPNFAAMRSQAAKRNRLGQRNAGERTPAP